MATRSDRTRGWPVTDSCHDGFTLVEVLIATAVLACGVAAVASLSLASSQAMLVARRNSVALTLARDKMEHLRALAWTSDGGVVPVSDWWSDLTRAAGSTGGLGLGVSPAGTLEADVPGYCDFADAGGSWVGAGSAPPPAAAWVRRWSIQPLPDAPADTLRFEVVVLPVRRSRGGGAAMSTPWAGRVRLVDIRARRAR